jgi:PAS domain S-box-containing protein
MIRWFRHSPIQRKLIVILMLTGVAGMLMMRVAFFTYEYVTFRAATLRQLAILGKVSADNSTAALAFGSPADANETLSALRAEPNIVAAALYDQAGRRFARYPAERAALLFPAAPGADGYRFSSSRLTGFEPVVQRDKRLGTLYLEFDAGSVLTAWLRGSLGIAAAVMAVAVVLAYLLARVLQKQISRPILALADAARAVSDRQDYSVRARKLSGDELGTLTDAFNRMLGDLEKITRELEQRVRDRTAELAAAHADLKREQARLKFIFDTAPVGISFTVTQADGAASRLINEAHLNICGLTREQARTQEDFNRISHPEDFARQRALVEQLEAGRIDRFTFDKRYLRPDGRTVWVILSAQRRKLEDGTREDLSIIVDITKRREAEEALRLSEARYRTLFSSLDEGFCVVELIFDGQEQPIDYRFLEVSPSFEKQTGLRDAVGRTMCELSPQHEAHWFETFGRIALTGEPARFQNRAEQLQRWFDVYAFRFGEPRHRQVAMLFNDISERKRAEAALTERTAQLEAANKELEAFSYSVSHDLRAPLRHVDGFANLLTKHAAAVLDAQGRRYVATISGAAKQMGRLIDDLLGFSRMNRTALRLAEVDQDALVAALVHEGHYDQNGTSIAWEIGSLPIVQADAAMLRQVWANLIQNAVKYSGRQPQPVVAIGCQPAAPGAAEHVCFVRDNGVGFDMAYADKLFGVFQRLHSAAEFEGTGIGLANVRRIVLRHGGRTWAEGRVGAGAVFYFSLPVNPSTL